MISNVLNFPKSEDVLQMTDRVMQQAYADAEHPFHPVGCKCSFCVKPRESHTELSNVLGDIISISLEGMRHV